MQHSKDSASAPSASRPDSPAPSESTGLATPSPASLTDLCCFSFRDGRTCRLPRRARAVLAARPETRPSTAPCASITPAANSSSSARIKPLANSSPFPAISEPPAISTTFSASFLLLWPRTASPAATPSPWPTSASYSSRPCPKSAPRSETLSATAPGTPPFMTPSQNIRQHHMKAPATPPTRPPELRRRWMSPPTNLQGLQPRNLSTFDFQLLTTFRMNTYKKRARNPFTMNTYKFIGLKPPLESTLTKKWRGGPPQKAIRLAVLTRPWRFSTVSVSLGAGAGCTCSPPEIPKINDANSICGLRRPAIFQDRRAG